MEEIQWGCGHVPWEVPFHVWVQLSDCPDPGKVTWVLFEDKTPNPTNLSNPPQGVGSRGRGKRMATSPGLGGPWVHGAAGVGQAGMDRCWDPGKTEDRDMTKVTLSAPIAVMNLSGLSW